MAGFSPSGRSSVASSTRSSLSRPSAKSIYLQRKEYSESINREMLQVQHRVEHLFTCQLDAQLRDVWDCVERLKILEASGRVWCQDVILEVRDGALRITDVETKDELESWPTSRVVDLQAVLDVLPYESLLTISILERDGLVTSVFLFQSEALRADYLKNDLERQLSRLELKRSMISSSQGQRNPRNISPPERMPHRDPDSEEDSQNQPIELDPLQTPSPSKESPAYISVIPLVKAPPPQQPYTERERNVDLLNHLLNDIEAFVDRLTAVTPKFNQKEKRKKKRGVGVKGLPSDEDFTVCLQKIKMCFNLLAKLKGKIKEPSAAELTHCLFSTLEQVVYWCSVALPPSVVSPLFEPECVVFLSEEATEEEDQLWQTLGDAWNIPSTRWPEDDDDVPTFTPVFDDGWEPPDIREMEPEPRPLTPQKNVKQASQEAVSSEELPASHMTALFDFTARNQRELSISKGEELQLLDMSRQWWKVRNQQGQVGYVPNNMLQPQEKPAPSVCHPETRSPALTRKSRAPEVQAWLELKGFTKVTVRCLGGLSGSMLLGMTREELKTVCPEEGGRVFNLLQKVKSALAVTNEVKQLT